MNIIIKESEWKTEKEIKLKSGVPYWIKLGNGNIVMATHINIGYCSGMAKLSIDKEHGLLVSQNEFYMCKDAKFQEVK